MTFVFPANLRLNREILYELIEKLLLIQVDIFLPLFSFNLHINWKLEVFTSLDPFFEVVDPTSNRARCVQKFRLLLQVLTKIINILLSNGATHVELFVPNGTSDLAGIESVGASSIYTYDSPHYVDHDGLAVHSRVESI